MYHYTESGLANVWLMNGYRIEQTHYGEGVAIDDVQGLHTSIAQALTENPALLTGAAFRFLRYELELSQREISARIGADIQAVKRWEKAANKAIPGLADRMTRTLYRASAASEPVRAFLDRLAALDAPDAPLERIAFEATPTGWRMAA